MSGPRSAPKPPRGIVRGDVLQRVAQHERHLPSSTLELVVEHYWSVRWDRRGHAPHDQQVVPHPSCHIVCENGAAELVGVMTRVFRRRLEGHGGVFGIKFKPGGFAALTGQDCSALTDKRLPLQPMLNTMTSPMAGEHGLALARAVDSCGLDQAGGGVAAAINHAEAFVLQLSCGRQIDKGLSVVGTAFERLRQLPLVCRTEDLTQATGVELRGLQRLFRRLVGVGPKWVINRYRMHEALERAQEGAVTNWAALAAELGYFDQAHFNRDFKQVLGVSPALLSRNVGTR